MGKPLPIVFCPRCRCAHEPGEHKAKPKAAAAPSSGALLLQAAFEHTKANLTDNGAGPLPFKKKRPAKKRRKKAVRPLPKPPAPAAAGFDRNAYQRAYMKDKRAADKLGISVKEYRLKKAAL